MRTLRISFTVNEQLAGSVLADLADRVQNLDFGVIEDVPHTKNKPRIKTKGNGANIVDTLITFLKTDQHVKDMRKALTQAGYKPGSLNGALHKLIKSKHVKRVGPGRYITAEKH